MMFDMSLTTKTSGYPWPSNTPEKGREEKKKKKKPCY
jgi:hypothetical protein